MIETTSVTFQEASAANNKALSIHRWANWIAGFSGDFVQDTIKQYLPSPRPDALLLEPFCGVGTALVEAYRAGINCVGFEINPFAALVSKVKLQSVGADIAALQQAIDNYVAFMQLCVENQRDLNLTPRSVAPAGFHTRIPFFSKTIEAKVLYTQDYIQELPQELRDIFRVALASVLVGFSNYTYEPSLGSRPGAGKARIHSAPVGDIVAAKLGQMVEDIALLQGEVRGQQQPSWAIHDSSYFGSASIIQPGSVDIIVTSPPYMNNYHYVRNTRPQLYWSALATSSNDLKHLEEDNVGKFWQTVRGRETIPLNFVLPELERQIEKIRQTNGDKGVYGGGGWANYISVYMNDLYRFAGLLSSQLRPHSGVAIVVLGNSVIQGTPISVERYMGQIAGLHGLGVEGTHSLRTRVGSSVVNTGTRRPGEEKYELYDFAVVLRRTAN